VWVNVRSTLLKWYVWVCELKIKPASNEGDAIRWIGPVQKVDSKQFFADAPVIYERKEKTPLFSLAMLRSRRRGSSLVRAASVLFFSLLAIYTIFLVSHSFRTTSSSSTLQQYISRAPHAYYPRTRDWFKSSSNLLLLHNEHTKLSRAGRRATAPPPIAVNSSLPSLDGLRPNSRLVEAWNQTLASVSRTARLQLERTFDYIFLHQITGVPGTNITSDDEAFRLQGYLDCVTSRGSWVYDRLGGAEAAKRLTVHKQDSAFASCDKRFYKGRQPRPHEEAYEDWDVRESLKFRWRPDKTCAALLPDHLESAPMSPNRSVLCRLLRHKSTLMLGDSASMYMMHDLLLDWTNEKPVTCYGDLYCSLHSLCSQGLRDGSNLDGSWEADERVFNRLPTPFHSSSSNSDHTKRGDSADDAAAVPEQQRQPTAEETIVDEDGPAGEKRAAAAAGPPPSSHKHPYGTLLRFRRTDGLVINAHADHERYSPVFVHPESGVREINTFAHGEVRHADVIVAGKPPLPLPEMGSAGGNWTEAMDDGGAWMGEDKAVLVLDAVRALTEEVWLPELMDSLRGLRRQSTSFDQLVLWKGGWRIHPDCSASQDEINIVDEHDTTAKGPAVSFDWQAWWESPGDGPPPLPALPSLRRLVYGGGPSSGTLSDKHLLFYNLQTIIQNHVLRTQVLPRLGIPYLDLETPMAIWRTGLVGSRDCLRPCLPSPGFSLEDTFVGGLQTIFAWGWDGDGRRENWLGSRFVPFREREKLKKKRAAAAG
jgi:hypothetical protein